MTLSEFIRTFWDIDIDPPELTFFSSGPVSCAHHAMKCILCPHSVSLLACILCPHSEWTYTLIIDNNTNSNNFN